MTQHREWKIGTHEARFESPNTLSVKIKGDIRVDEASQLIDICAELGAREPFYLIADMSEIGTIPSEARGVASKQIRPEWYRGVVYVGASFVAKAAVKSLSVVFYLAGKYTADVEFVSTPEEAPAALARQRAKHRIRVA
ncbi:hypothetical protein [Vitiosangium sp. GDMCC 1.1324]|uniref:hypothetical protein n=1 Tax=Vitiosangium sp. (strain GDMCC 1.1324) TaxID=2138576 RepID=UPI000D3D2408|nr:hypothetical protein [Vitiosangium sp. GDMCC 1.1324]PTL82994.1 hypothetical protein DAT35_13295 [Vitiosangium sp. GDMCC 1.1324]